MKLNLKPFKYMCSIFFVLKMMIGLVACDTSIRGYWINQWHLITVFVWLAINHRPIPMDTNYMQLILSIE